jgi:alpha-mannosidase
VKQKLVWDRFKNLDKLIHYANLDGRLNVFYSTPAIYTKSKNSYNHTWPLKTDDFFPYSDCDRTCYWTGGYFA